MSIKEYLQTNNSPLFETPKNILILEWLEANIFCTPIEISKNIHLSLQEVNEILQILYKNSLISFYEDKYIISSKGIELLNRLGLSDLQITNLLNQTDFEEDEYTIYKAIFKTWRAEFLDYYLIISNLIKNECDNICLPYFSDLKIPKKKNYTSIFVATLLHEVGHILYTNEKSLLMSHYTDLYYYSLANHCSSSEVYHFKSDYWKTDNTKSDFCVFIINSLRKQWANFFLCLPHHQSNTENNYLFLKNTYNTYHLNQDFALSHKIATDVDLLNSIFTCKNLKQLSDMLHMTETQAKFVLKNIRSKIDCLLPSETDTIC